MWACVRQQVFICTCKPLPTPSSEGLQNQVLFLFFVQFVELVCLVVFIALFCPCSLRSFPMLYVAFARRVKRPTRRAGQRLSFTAPNVITAVSSHCWFWRTTFTFGHVVFKRQVFSSWINLGCPLWHIHSSVYERAAPASSLLPCLCFVKEETRVFWIVPILSFLLSITGGQMHFSC